MCNRQQVYIMKELLQNLVEFLRIIQVQNSDLNSDCIDKKNMVLEEFIYAFIKDFVVGFMLLESEIRLNLFLYYSKSFLS